MIYQHLKTGEDPQSLQLNNIDIWVHVYDLPHGRVTEKILQSISNYIGEDPNNVTEGWRMNAYKSNNGCKETFEEKNEDQKRRRKLEMV